MPNFKQIEQMFGKWRKTIAEKAGPMFNAMRERLSFGAKSTMKYIREHPGQAMLAAGAATTIGIAIAKLRSRTELSRFRASDGSLISENLKHYKLFREAQSSLNSLDAEDLSMLSDFERRTAAIEAAIKSSRIILSNDDEAVHEYFVHTLLIQIALFRSGYSLLCPEDHQHLIAFIAELMDNEDANYSIDQALTPLSLSVAQDEDIQLEDIV
jgi:hypothetical protein